MERVTLGAVGVTSSVLGFGTSGLMRVSGRRQRQNVLAAAFAAGMTHFDTAPIYGLGESERALGGFMQGRRTQFTVTTKFGLRPSPLAARLGPYQRLVRPLFSVFPSLRSPAAGAARSTLYHPPTFGLNEVRTSLEQSLRSLRTDYVDFYLAHECSANAAPAGDLLGFLEDLCRAGRIRAYGIAANFERTRSLLAVRSDLGRVVQFESDFFEPNVERLRADPASVLITHSALAQAVPRLRGLLNERPSLAQRCRRELGIASDEDAALGFMLLRAAILANSGGVVLMQSGSPERIAQNARAAGSTSADDAIRRLRELLDEVVDRDT